MKVIYQFPVVLVVLTFSCFSFAAKNLEDQRQDLLIQKFEKVLLQLSQGDPSRVPVTLRLADLLAERARIGSLAELDSGCINCIAGKKDRKRAINYYSQVLPKVREAQKAKVLSQMGHLYELQGQVPKAIGLYQKVVRTANDPLLVAEAEISLAEVYFKKQKYSEAFRHYSNVLKQEKSPRRGLAAYRRAWCLFKLGEVKKAVAALEKQLNTPELLTRSGTIGAVSVDQQFKEEVSRDLGTFYAQSTAGLAEAKKLYQSSPESTRLDNVSYLATELERLGQPGSAIEVWKFTLNQQSDPKSRLEGQIRLADLYLNLKDRKSSIVAYTQALHLWKELESSKVQANDERKKRLKNYIIDWHKREKKYPTEELQEAYAHYLEVFPKEVDMMVFSAHLARKREDWNLAYKLYGRSGELVQDGVRFKKVKDTPTFESLLLSQLEIAELSKNKEKLSKAYSNYLDKSEAKTKFIEVHYQKARLNYDSGNYKAAAEELRAVALISVPKASKKGAHKIQLQAADLALDALALLKQDEKIEAWVGDFYPKFPSRQKEYRKLVRSSLFNQSAKAAQDMKTVEDLNQAWVLLEKINISDASEKEKIQYYKNKLILAEKLNKYDESRRVANQLLRFGTLSVKDRQFALSRKAWLAELVLDFKTAYKVTRNLKMRELKPQQKTLKLALFSELAGESSKKHYVEYIETLDKSSKDDLAKAQAVSSRLVRESKNPKHELGKFRRILIKNPELWARLNLEIYAKDPKPQYLKALLKDKLIRPTLAGKVLWRLNFITKFQAQDKGLKSHQINSKSQKLLNLSLRQRIKLIEQMDKTLAIAVNQSDWTGQMLVVDSLARETERLYQEIISLPMPDGLTSDQEQEYLSLLSQQAGPYQLRSADLKKKFVEFWKDPSVVQDLEKSVNDNRPPLRKLFTDELKVVAGLAPEAIQPHLLKVASSQYIEEKKPNISQLEQVKQLVRNDPMNKTHLNTLLQLEKEMGREAMISYLENRIDLLQGQKSKEI